MEIRNCGDLGKTKNEYKKIYLFIYLFTNSEPHKKGPC